MVSSIIAILGTIVSGLIDLLVCAFGYIVILITQGAVLVNQIIVHCAK